MNDPKRQEIKDRIAASQARNDARVANLPVPPKPPAPPKSEQGGIIGFVKRHPLATIAGGLAVGALVAGLFPTTRKSARKVASQGSARATALGALGSQLAVNAFEQFLDAASGFGKAGGEKLGDLGDTLGDTARGARREARYLADKSGDTARIATRDTGKAITRAWHRLGR